MKFTVVAAYLMDGKIVDMKLNTLAKSLRDAQLYIEDMWELDLEGADIWVEELLHEDRETLFPKRINPHLFVCENVAGFDRIEYRIMER